MASYKAIKNSITGLLVAFLLLLSACAGRSGHLSYEEMYVSHTITFSGETMGLIAAWYTGSSQNWTAIRDANPGIDPNRLRLGTVIRIPRAIAQKDTPLTKAFLDSSRGRRGDVKSKTDIPPSSEPQGTETPPTQPSPEVSPEVGPETVPVQPQDNQASATTTDTQQGGVSDPVTAATQTASPEVQAPAQDRTQSRDQLLKELLEDY